MWSNNRITAALGNFSGGRLRIGLAIITAVGYVASDGAGASESGMSARELQQIAAAATAAIGSSIGRIEIKSFDDPPRDDAAVTKTSPIQVLVGDSRVSPVPNVYSNCRADPPARVILCDARLLDDIIDEFALARGTDPRTMLREQIFALVLAHELGHIVLKHGSAAYHGDDKGFSIFKYANHQTELAADAFAVRAIDNAVGDKDAYYFVIVQLATAALAKSLCPDTFPGPCPCPGYTNAASCSRIPYGPGLLIAEDDKVTVELTGTHPEFVVRFSRLLFLSTNKRFRDIYGNEARQVLRHIVVRDESGKLETTAPLFR